MLTSTEIRQQFLDFFVKKHAHAFVPSSPVVPHDDPTLLFTNAGMNQFKPIFLGQEMRAYTRAANTQKCIRAGGKHNDLDDVGRSRRHHTFFEMLGNWSFGDYFKRGAIEMAWELLTNVWKLDPTRLHVSCFEGSDGVPRDEEAANLWKEVAGVADDHIHYFGKDNFWEMGDTGPCGPCTEIYIDRTPDKSGGPQVNGDDPRVMEIWNLVFIQYNRDATGKLTELPAQHVDTGMGFERITQVLQDKQDNYGTDLWSPIFRAISDLSGLKYEGKFPKTNAADPIAEAADAQLRHDIAFRVIGDHLRTLTFALTDGAVPSNEGRGYVLRRILRRAVRFGRQQLGLNEPFLHKLVPTLVDAMGDAFPELRKNPNHVIELIQDEEVSFGKTLNRGIELFEDAARAGSISAQDAFKLHDTYGFPIDLTRIMAEERGMKVDIVGYETLMEEARELARAGGKEAASKVYDLNPDAIGQLAKNGAKPTDDRAKFSHDPVKAKVLGIWNGTNFLRETDVSDDQEIAIILDQTNFYSEMGGQVGDVGMLASAGVSFDVTTTRIIAGYVLHIGRIRSGKLTAHDNVTATVAATRAKTEQNHTTTHVTNWALRETLGEGIQQKGSLVDPEKLRFDFSHGKPMSDDELGRVESLVSACIAKRLPVFAEIAPQEQALKINGLRAVFGEKYPPMVRVVSIGAPVKDLLADPTNAKWREFSIEFCGGTHLANAAEAEHFVVTSDESVSKGIRRIVAHTGRAASAASERGKTVTALIDRAKDAKEFAPLIADLQKHLAGDVLPLRVKRSAQSTVAELQDRQRKAEKAAAKAGGGGAGLDIAAIATDLLSRATEVPGGGKVIVDEMHGATDDQLRAILDSLRKRETSLAALLGTSDGQKVTFIAVVSDDLIARGLKAGDWIRDPAKTAGGGGGGKPQMAQAGGKDLSKLKEALEVARAFAKHTLHV